MKQWISFPMSDLPIASGKSINPLDFPDEEFELYSVPSHETGKPEIVKGREIGSNKQIVFPGTVLLCKINPRINRTWVVGKTGKRRQIASTEWIAFESSEEIEQRYLMYFMQQSDLRDFLAANASGVGGSLMRIKPATLKGLTFRLPPRAEQTRIVEKLEELLGGLDAAVGELKAAQRKLTHYRQSLLKAAMEGALTEAWRSSPSPCPRSGQGEVGRGSLLPSDKSTPPQPSPSPSAKGREQETGTQLLHRILQERRTRWEEKQLAKFAQTGKTPPKGWQAKYPEPVAPDTTDLPALPEGWAWASLDALVADSSYGTSAKCGYGNNGTPVLRIPNVSGGDLDLRDMKFSDGPLPLTAEDFLDIGDVLVIRTNGSIGLVGRAAAVTAPLPAPHYFASYLLRLRCVNRTVLHHWVSTFLASPVGRRWIEERAASSAGQHNVSLSTLLTMPVPLPPLEEQTEILTIVDAQLSAAKEQETAITHTLHQAAAQRRNLLRAAFSGQLVPQDPNDEPASALLARIRAARKECTSKTKPAMQRKRMA